MQSGDTNVPGVILAGGAGRRIGGAKAHVPLAGRPLWSYVAGRISPQVSALAANGTGNFGYLPSVVDLRAGMGPLAGIVAAMEWAASLRASRVLTVAVDTPFLPDDLVKRLLSADGPIVMARTADGLHGTTAIWDVALANMLANALGEGARKVTDWAETIGITPVDFPDQTPPLFFNINTPEDLAQAEAWLE